MVTCLTSNQKQQLADSLNFYYDHGIAKYSKGLVLRCTPESESILKQFSWFHRNTITYYLASPPDYHDILSSTVDFFEIIPEEEAQELSSSRLETKIIYWQQQTEADSTTVKDKQDMLITLVDLGSSLFVASTSPIGLSISAAALLSKAGSDPAKSIPAIVVFQKIRSQNLVFSILSLSFLTLLITAYLTRKK